MQISNNYTPYKNTPSFGSNNAIVENAAKFSRSKVAKMIEFERFNMSFPVMLAIMAFGVVVPRIRQAQDEFDKQEIIRRDAVTIATLLMGAPALNKLFSKVNENKSGFVLADKAAEEAKDLNVIQKLKNALIPGAGRNVYSSDELVSKYSGITKNNEGIVGFSKFIDNGKGNLKKIFDSDKKIQAAVKEIVGDAYNTADNKKFIESFSNASKESLEKLYKLLEPSGNALVKKAKSMNSSFNFLSTFFLVPALLGFGIPKVNEYITKKQYKAKKAAEAEAKAKEEQAKPQPYNNPYFMQTSATKAEESKKVFNPFKKA